MVSKQKKVAQKNNHSLKSVNNMPSSIIFAYTYLSFSSLLLCCIARDTITVNNLLSDDPEDTLVSAGKTFELGFFTPTGSSDFQRYLGIWYYKMNPPTVVWVANRDKPISGPGGVFVVASDGNLKVLDGKGNVFWYTDLKTTSNSAYRKAQLLDSGNLILVDNHSTTNLWQSFEEPTDTFLPGMKMDQSLKLTSWKSQVDPAEGNFTFTQDEDEENRFKITLNSYSVHWRSGESGEFFGTEKMPHQMANFLSNFSGNDRPSSSEARFNSFPLSNFTIPRPLNFNKTRMVMDIDGEIKFWGWDKEKKEWFLLWWEPRDRCNVFNACGNFGSCNIKNKVACKCLPGFKPISLKDWNSGEFFRGCTQNSLGVCGKKDIFLNLTNMNAEKGELSFVVKDETECRQRCLNSCQCQAYSYTQGKNSTRRDETTKGNICWIWTDNLRNLREYTYGGHDIFVRVAVSDIESTTRNCEPCGSYVIPYPLSTGSKCGDPMYSSFNCNQFTGMIGFKTPTGTYNVTSINPSGRAFVIEAKDADNCDARNSQGEIVQLNQSLPFTMINLIRWCDAKGANLSSVILTKGLNEIEISWKPPPEPTCNSKADCMDWPHSACNVTGHGESRCLCSANYRWNASALNCTQEERDYAQPFGGSPRKKRRLSLIIGVAIASIIVLSCSIVLIWMLRRKKAKKLERKENIERNEALLYGTEKRVKDLIGSEDFKEEDKKGIDVPFFNLDSILAATDNFSDTNKLGRGGFGPVYKGRFPGGQDIAIKRLSSVSGQGLEEFKNEVVLIARLQHRNLVKLLGYCVTRDEKILLYEYMPNKSLDSFIFDRNLSTLLAWEMRFNIILGVARGILYLHQDSRLRIIHRDLKTSNILLDDEMNPKISDFGLARMFEGKQTEGSTNRVVGTYGYMSPEYALDGLFSVKSDVFSFGVVVLEILSGKRNTGYFKSEQEQAFSLLGYAWRLWREDKALDLMDETLRESCNTNQFLQCVNVALLCAQDDPADRPTMPTVLVMLSSETVTLPTPKQPTFVVIRGLSSSTSTSKQETNRDMIVSIEEGR